MNTVQKNAIVEALEGYLAVHKISQNEFADKAKINSAYISRLLNGKFTVNAGNGNEVEITDKYFLKIAEHIGYAVEKKYWEIRVTDEMKHMLATLQDARTYGYTNVIVGETGCGKSYVVNLFAKQNPTDVTVVTVGNSDNLGDLLDKILDKINLPAGRTKSKKIRDITAYMKRQKMEGKTPTLIFDESEYMKHPTICAMKELYDNLINHCAIVMVGTNQFLSKVEKMRRKNKDGIPQLYRRIKFGIRQLPAIDRSFKLFLNDFEKPVISFLQGICDNYGELHDVLMPTIRESERTGENITVDFIKKVVRLQ
jgi:DNA transposition AAA+ family ATPase